MFVKNSSELLSHGYIEGRRIAIELIEAGISTETFTFLVQGKPLFQLQKLSKRFLERG